MDDQGIDKALMYPASAHDIEFEFADDLEAIYANIRAFNRWIHEEIGYAYQDRMFLPPYLALADVDLALAELEILLETGTPMVQFKSGHAHGGRDNPFGGRSIADPVFDPIWARINEAGPARRRAPRGHRLPEVRRRLERGPRGHLRRLRRVPVGHVLG